MMDYSDVFLQLKGALQDYHNNMLKKQFEVAYDFAEQITDLAQKLEDITRQVHD